MNTVTCTDVRYVCGRDDPQPAQAYVTRIRNWGDVVTLATAAMEAATAFTGADDDFDDVDVTVERFREDGVWAAQLPDTHQ